MSKDYGKKFQKKKLVFIIHFRQSVLFVSAATI